MALSVKMVFVQLGLLLAILMISDFFPETTGLPSTCPERLSTHSTTKLTEFPMMKTENNNNFASFGEKCSLELQLEFEKTMYTEFEKGIRNGQVNAYLMARLDEVWNDWRLVPREEGICNPKRLLTCDPVKKTCVCRQKFLVEGQFHRKAYESIVLKEEIDEAYNAGEDRYENVTTCRAVSHSPCEWEVTWLGSCNLRCAKGHECIGTSQDFAKSRCVPCDKSTDDGLDLCIENAIKVIRESLEKDKQLQEEQFSSNLV